MYIGSNIKIRLSISKNFIITHTSITINKNSISTTMKVVITNILGTSVCIKVCNIRFIAFILYFSIFLVNVIERMQNYLIALKLILDIMDRQYSMIKSRYWLL